MCSSSKINIANCMENGFVQLEFSYVVHSIKSLMSQQMSLIIPQLALYRLRTVTESWLTKFSSKTLLPLLPLQPFEILQSRVSKSNF